MFNLGQKLCPSPVSQKLTLWGESHSQVWTLVLGDQISHECFGRFCVLCSKWNWEHAESNQGHRSSISLCCASDTLLSVLSKSFFRGTLKKKRKHTIPYYTQWHYGLKNNYNVFVIVSSSSSSHPRLSDLKLSSNVIATAGQRGLERLVPVSCISHQYLPEER